jgi:MFS family permease
MRGFNLNYWAINLGFAAAGIIAGLLAHTPRMTLFGLDAATTVISSVWIFMRVQETRPVRGLTLKASDRKGLAHVLTDRTFLTFVTLSLGLWTIVSTIGLMPITMLDRGLSPSAYGAVIALNGVIIVIGQLFVPRLIRGHSRTKVLVIATLFVSVGFGAIAYAPTVLLLGVTVVIWTLGEMGFSPSNAALVAELSLPSMRGRYQGVSGLSFTVAGFLAPVVGGVIIDHFGNTALWLGAFGLGIVVAIGQAVTGPARERRALELRQPVIEVTVGGPVADPTPAVATEAELAAEEELATGKS